MMRHCEQEIRVGVIDDDPIIACGLQALCASHHLNWVGSASSTSELLAEKVLQVGDVVLLDMQLGDGSQAGENVARLQEIGVRVIVYTSGTDLHAVRQAVGAGAFGIMNKGTPLAEVVEGIRQVGAGEILAAGEWAAAVQADWELCDSLGEKHRDILRVYATGIPAKQVARQLSLSINTVNTYMHQVRNKLLAGSKGAGNRVDVYLSALRMGLLAPPEHGQRPL